jgi:hypothetical protein
MLYPSELQARGCFVTEGKKSMLHFRIVILSLIRHTRQQAG